MAKTLTAGMQAAVAKQFTNPIYLVEQVLGDAGPLRSSTREQIEYPASSGEFYLATTGLEVTSINNDTVSWSLDNSDRQMSVYALSENVGGSAVTVYLHYEGETVERFTGIIDEWETVGQRLVFRATSQAAKQQKFPNERAENGTFNHLPAPGTSLVWGQQTIILEAEPI